MRPADVVLLSTADWDNPFWTNKQHVAKELARRGHRVLYVDSLGLRRPSASVQDAARIWNRLNKALRPPRRVEENLWVWSPAVLPFQRWSSVRTLNRRVLSRWLNVLMAALRFEPALLWTYNPMTVDLLDTRRFRRIVYHCVDDISSQPGMPSEALAAAEQRTAESADIVFATSPHLAETRGRWNPNTHFLPNVADYEHFAQARRPQVGVPDDLIRIPGPRVGFVGAVSGYKVDFGLVRHIAESRPDWSVVLIGKVGEGDPWTDPTLLEGLPNLHLLGPRSYEELPAYLRGFDAAMLPNTLNSYTRSMFPMKFFEYLAAGVPVVSVDLPAIREFSEGVTIAGSRSEFLRGLERAITGMCPSLRTRLALAREHTYRTRTDRMMQLITASAAGGTP